MSELDFKKQLLINEFKTLSKGKSNDEILPLILALSRKAQQSGISFSKDDIYLIIDQVKDGLTPKRAAASAAAFNASGTALIQQAGNRPGFSPGSAPRLFHFLFERQYHTFIYCVPPGFVLPPAPY